MRRYNIETLNENGRWDVYLNLGNIRNKNLANKEWKKYTNLTSIPLRLVSYNPLKINPPYRILRTRTPS